MLRNKELQVNLDECPVTPALLKKIQSVLNTNARNCTNNALARSQYIYRNTLSRLEALKDIQVGIGYLNVVQQKLSKELEKQLHEEAERVQQMQHGSSGAEAEKNKIIIEQQLMDIHTQTKNVFKKRDQLQSTFDLKKDKLMERIEEEQIFKRQRERNRNKFQLKLDKQVQLMQEECAKEMSVLTGVQLERDRVQMECFKVQASILYFLDALRTHHADDLNHVPAAPIIATSHTTSKK
jgi:hypothetical protein